MSLAFTTFDFKSASLDSAGNLITRRLTNRGAIIELEPGISLAMMEIPAGTFMMGAADSEPESRDSERPVHRVNVPSFFMGRFPVTQSQWLAVLKKSPEIDGEFLAPELPVVNVWLERALDFCFRLSKRTGLSIRLPSEAEWEYACRAGTVTRFNFGDTIPTDMANYNGEPLGRGPAGRFRARTTVPGSINTANAFGLFDTHGNVWEWCADIWHPDYFGAPGDGSAWLTGGDRSYCVQRGGSWANRPGACRSAFRVGDIAHNNDNLVGLRVCFTI